MTAPPERDTLERFRAALSLRLGLCLDDGKLGLLADLLHRRTEETRQTVDAYVAELEQRGPRSPELSELAQAVTVPETYFFRDSDQMRAFVEVALPERIRSCSGLRPLRILSAGCASGDEAYSLAMIAHDAGIAANCGISILGIDVNPAMLKKARRGRYSPWALRETPAAIQTRFFRADGREFLLDETIRAMATFEERNLANDDDAFWRPEAFDVVFCRNVIMYFTPETARAVIDRISRSLTPGGFLFLGHAETLRGLSSAFHLHHTHGTFFYQNRQVRPWRDDAEIASEPVPRPVRPAAIQVMAPGAGASWFEAIQHASERVRLLTAPRATDWHPAMREAGRHQGAEASRSFGVDLALELMRHERFSEAYATLNALPSGSARDPEVLLLRAVLFTHGGDLARAEATCTELLERDEASAGAHYLMALCRESARDHRGAFDHDQIATHLDSCFAMPRLHLGLLARRGGNREAARQELGRALTLLQRDDTSRLLLFGGGFNRDALIALCRAELASCGRR